MKASTDRRGYGREHQKARAALKPDVDAGKAWCCELVCVMPTRWIRPGTAWDLAHDRRRPGTYLGPAHAKCNRVEGAKHQSVLARRPKRRQPRRWAL